MKKKRHKCHLCGAVRYEEKMEKIERYDPLARGVGGYFGNDDKLWKCKKHDKGNP